MKLFVIRLSKSLIRPGASYELGEYVPLRLVMWNLSYREVEEMQKAQNVQKLQCSPSNGF